MRRDANQVPGSISSDKPSTNNLSLSAINGWRGPGALAIAFAHFVLVTDFFNTKAIESLALVVDLFFVFSGVVIAQAYGKKLEASSALPEYIIRRFGRIWPLHAATLAILLLYELLKLVLVTKFGKQSNLPPFATDGPNFLAAIPSNLLLIHALGVHNRETWNFPSWSLSVEFFTYIAFAAFCLLRPLQRYVLSTATIFVSVAVLIFVAPWHMRSTFDFGIFRCLAGFFAGTLCYDAMSRWPLPRWPFPTVVEVVAILFTGLWLVNAADGAAAYAAPFVFSVFVAIFIAHRGAVSALLSRKLFQFLAELSFAIYMVHAIVLLLGLAALHVLARAGFASSFVKIPKNYTGLDGARLTMEVLHVTDPVMLLVMGVIYGVMVLVSAYLLFRYIEVPGRIYFAGLGKAVDRKMKRGRPSPADLTKPASTPPG